MPQTLASFATPKAKLTLKQLRKHFGQEAPTAFTTPNAHVSLASGARHPTVSDELQTLGATASEPKIGEIKRFLANHLPRLIFREPHTLVWQRTA